MCTIQYVGTGTHWHIDSALLKSTFNHTKPRIQEINLLAYLLNRMDRVQEDMYMTWLDRATNNDGIKKLINMAYCALGSETMEQYTGENLSELIETERLYLAPYSEMNQDVFWQMIGEARQKHNDDYDAAENELIDQLSKMPPEGIRRFSCIRDIYFQAANLDALYCVGNKLNDGLSDDGFMDFRGWLMGQGKEIYMNALKSPESILKADLKPNDGYYLWETFNYIPSTAYELRTGQNLYEQKLELSKNEEAQILSELPCDGSEKQYVSAIEEIMQSMNSPE